MIEFIKWCFRDFWSTVVTLIVFGGLCNWSLFMVKILMKGSDKKTNIDKHDK